MKYYKHKSDGEKKLLKLRIKEFTKNERKNYKWNKILSRLCIILFFVEFVTIIILAKNMNTLIQNSTVANTISVILYILLFPIPIGLTIFGLYIVGRFFQVHLLPEVKNDMIQKVINQRMKFYGLTKNYIVTKCYQSSNEVLNNKDVLICCCNNKIKLTNDFYHSVFDFGCYEFDLYEVTYLNIKEDGLIKTKLSIKDMTFILGYRAKTFIEKNKSN